MYLPLRYLLTECVHGGRYNYIEYDEEHYLAFVRGEMRCTRGSAALNTAVGDDERRHGPAILNKGSHPTLLSIDTVPCVRCLVWPPQAADWPTRHRNYGWPDSAILVHVVSNGCDVVAVAHRQC